MIRFNTRGDLSGNLYVRVSIRNRTKRQLEEIKPEDMNYDQLIAYLIENTKRVEYARIRQK